MVSNICYFHPYLGKIPILTNIFQRGWNHQVDNYSKYTYCTSTPIFLPTKTNLGFYTVQDTFRFSLHPQKNPPPLRYRSHWAEVCGLSHRFLGSDPVGGHAENLRSHPQGPLEDTKRTFHQQFMFRKFFLCGGERGSLGYLPRVCGQNHWRK